MGDIGTTIMRAGTAALERDTTWQPPLRSVAAAAEPLDVSILIVTWNSERWIERCLEALPRACNGLRYEIIVHDNASSDDTLRGLDADGLRILRSNENAGFAAGTNRAFLQSHGRYVFLLNPDCELESDTLTTLVAFLDANPEVAAAAPLLVDDEGVPQREFQLRRFPTFAALAWELLLLDKIFPRNRTTAHYRYQDLDLTEPRAIEQPAAAAFVIRRDVFDSVGPLDEQFSPAWFEDVDFCRRLAKANHSVFVVPAARARHIGGASLEHMPFARFIDLWYRNMWRYARKWHQPGTAEALRWTIMGGMVLRCVAAALGAPPQGVKRGDAVRAYVDVLRKAFDRWDDSSPSSS
jgi:GT2 family glycosyltransferase